MGWDDYPPEVWEEWRRVQRRAYPWNLWMIVALLAGWIGKPTLANVRTRWPWLCVVVIAVVLSAAYLVRYVYGMCCFMRMAKAKRFPSAPHPK